MPAIKTKRRVFIAAIVVVFLLLAILMTFYWRWSIKYQNRVYPNTWVGAIDLSGRTLDEARQLINDRTDLIEQSGIKFRYNSKNTVLALASASLDAGLVSPVLLFNNEQTAAASFNNQGRSPFLAFVASPFKKSYHQEISAAYLLSAEQIQHFLQESFPELNIPKENAYFYWSNKTGERQLQISPEKIGKEINYDQVLIDINRQLNSLVLPEVVITTRSTYPSVSQADLEPVRPQADKLIQQGSLILRVTNLTGSSSPEFLTIAPEKIITWVSIDKNNDEAILSLDQEKIKKYLSDTVAPKIDREAIRPRFEISNGKVSSWQTGQNGQKVNLDLSAAKIATEFIAGTTQIDLIIEEVSGAELISDNNFKIQEIIGTGHSNFKGSPTNRRKNIQVGANSLHGLLIKPGEEFSLMNALGEIDGANGYLQELVIKGNKTVPEYGGGLCQIGTTMFRTALATGLPITMRQNHSYRVSYYEPAGTDATIYDPWPDLRFINDTGNYILIQARINKDDLYFDFWGVRDGRIATTTSPVIYNIVKPEATKIVETDTLKPGEKKCTESSHNGADAYFDYKVIYPEGATTTPIQERRFQSHYVPWRAVCLVGQATSTAATSTSPTSNQSTTTPPTTSSSTTPNI